VKERGKVKQFKEGAGGKLFILKEDKIDIMEKVESRKDDEMSSECYNWVATLDPKKEILSFTVMDEQIFLIGPSSVFIM